MNKKSFYHMKMNAISHVCMVAGLCHFVFFVVSSVVIRGKKTKNGRQRNKKHRLINDLFILVINVYLNYFRTNNIVTGDHINPL